MLFYDRVDLREGIDRAENYNSKILKLCQYWPFLIMGLNIKTLFVIVLMICWFWALILAIL